jgi:TetR/AcrR family transcriptional regulator, cholesterol catabolism regulator
MSASEMVVTTPNIPELDAEERILTAAGRLFREKGFAATTVREIAAAADMLPGSLHYRYSSKDDVLLALMSRGVHRAIEAVRVATAQVGDPVERLRYALRAHLELLCNGDDSLYVLLFDWRSLPQGAREGLERERGKYESFWDGMLLDAHASGRARPILDVEMVRHFGFGAINWVATWYRPDMQRTPVQIADSVFTFLCFGLIQESARPNNVEALFEMLLSPPTHTLG